MWAIHSVEWCPSSDLFACNSIDTSDGTGAGPDFTVPGAAEFDRGVVLDRTARFLPRPRVGD